MPRLTDTSIPAAADEAAPPAAWRRLVPVAAVAALVAAMIVRGLVRHDANVRAVRGQPGRGLEIVRAFVDDAARFVEGGQQGDGSWAYGRSPTPGLETLDPAPRVAATARILLAARAAGYDSRPAFVRGLAFVRAHQERLGRWLATGAPAPEDRIEGTVGALAAGVLLLGPEGMGSEAARQLRARGGPAGLYPHRLDAGAPRTDPIPLADNVALLAALEPLGLDAAPLASALRREFDEGRVEPAAGMVARYLASLAGSRADSHALRWLLSPGPVLPAPAAEFDSLALGARMKVRADECLREEDTCQDLNPVAVALIQRRHLDGSWTPAPYQKANGFTGSAFETTAVVMSGLSAYRRVLEGRASGKLVSGEEKEALKESVSPRRR